MKTQPLSAHIQTSAYEGQERSLRSQLVGEICERLIEWSEVENREKVKLWIMSLATIASDDESTEAVWLYLRISTGDLGQLTASYSELGRQRNRTKQAQQQETERAMRVIAKHKPQLAKHLAELLRHHQSKE